MWSSPQSGAVSISLLGANPATMPHVQERICRLRRHHAAVMEMPDEMDGQQLQVAMLNWVESSSIGRDIPGSHAGEDGIIGTDIGLKGHICSRTKQLDCECRARAITHNLQDRGICRNAGSQHLDVHDQAKQAANVTDKLIEWRHVLR
ncbi:hypothetical protein ACP93_14245 [Xanthomonas sp. NCPPB 1128]|nr:hypothetical protein ACP93_14245 [Xanthomonas sp. NCPPB 1128]